jgi:hypothetical protein
LTPKFTEWKKNNWRHGDYYDIKYVVRDWFKTLKIKKTVML